MRVWIALAGLAGLAVACRSPMGRECGIWTSLNISGHDLTVFPGDGLRQVATVVTAPAYMGEDGRCDAVTYTSETRPSVFTWHSSDTTILAVSGDRFAARRVGSAALRVTSALQTASKAITVAPAVASLTVTATPAVARIGDTVDVVVEARDGAGNIVVDALLYEPIRDPASAGGPWLPGLTPTRGRFVMASTVPVRIISTARYSLRIIRDTAVVTPP